MTKFFALCYTLYQNVKGGILDSIFMKPKKYLIHLLTEILQDLSSTREQIKDLQITVVLQGEAMSAAFDRLKASVDTLSATDQKLIDLINAGVTGTPDADISTLADAVDAENAKVQAAVDAHNPPAA